MTVVFIFMVPEKLARMWISHAVQLVSATFCVGNSNFAEAVDRHSHLGIVKTLLVQFSLCEALSELGGGVLLVDGAGVLGGLALGERILEVADYHSIFHDDVLAVVVGDFSFQSCRGRHSLGHFVCSHLQMPEQILLGGFCGLLELRRMVLHGIGYGPFSPTQLSVILVDLGRKLCRTVQTFLEPASIDVLGQVCLKLHWRDGNV